MRASEQNADRVGGSAAAMRRLFDQRFASPATPAIEKRAGFLAIRVGSDPYALRLSEIEGLHADLKIVALPTPVSQLLGIVGLRGTMAPVYDLAALMRYPSAERARWVVLAGGAKPVGLAFETFEAYLQESAASIASGEGEGGSDRQHTRGVVREAGGAPRPIIHLNSVVKLIGDDRT